MTISKQSIDNLINDVVLPFEKYILDDELVAKHIEDDEIKAKHDDD